MKIFKFYLVPFVAAFILSACELHEVDNFKAPDSTIHGGIYDQVTGELIQQDIIQGMQIEFVENGFDNPEIQYMAVKNDGTYRNNLMFSGTYTIRPVRGNFQPIPPKGVQVHGETKIDFKVTPYIRIKNLKIDQKGSKVVATFNLQQTVENKVSKIGLFVHREPNVGSPLNTVSSVMAINSLVYPDTEFTLEIDMTETAGKLKTGEQYYFRVGALIDAPEAKFNYAPAVRLTL